MSYSECMRYVGQVVLAVEILQCNVNKLSAQQRCDCQEAIKCMHLHANLSSLDVCTQYLMDEWYSNSGVRSTHSRECRTIFDSGRFPGTFRRCYYLNEMQH